MRAADQLVSHWYPRPQWAAGDRFLTWFLTVDAHPALQALAVRYQQVVADLTSLDAVPPRWLHITVQGVGNTVGADPAEAAEIRRAVASRLAGTAAPTATFRRPTLFAEGLVLTPSDPGALTRVRAAIRAGIADVRGPGGVTEPDEYHPHVSLAYCNAPSDPAPVLERLREVDAAGVAVTFGHVAFVELERRPPQYVWRTLDTVRFTDG